MRERRYDLRWISVNSFFRARFQHGGQRGDVGRSGAGDRGGEREENVRAGTVEEGWCERQRGEKLQLVAEQF